MQEAKKMKYKSFILPLLGLMVAACGRDIRKAPDVEPDSVDVVPLYRYFADGDSAAVMADTALTRTFLQVVNYPLDTLSRSAAFWSNSLPVGIFTPAVDSIFGHEGPDIARIAGYAQAAAREEGLDLPRREYVAVVYGRRESMVFADSILFIALNHYLGSDYRGYQGFPIYERLVKTPEQLPYDVAEAIVATSYPYEAPDDGATVISNMLYNGALALSRLYLVENSNPAEALGYSQEAYSWLLDHEKLLWETLVGKKLLYDIDPQTVRKLVGPAPSTAILDPGSPGRVGRFLGFRLIEKYMKKHPETRLSDLLSPDFYSSPDTPAEVIGGYI